MCEGEGPGVGEDGGPLRRKLRPSQPVEKTIEGLLATA